MDIKAKCWNPIDLYQERREKELRSLKLILCKEGRLGLLKISVSYEIFSIYNIRLMPLGSMLFYLSHFWVFFYSSLEWIIVTANSY